VGVRRLTAAIVKGGELTALVVALETHERQRREGSARLAALHSPVPRFDARTVRRELGDYLIDWQKLLSGHVHQAQQIVRRLVKGRLTMEPQAAGYYTFSGTGTVRPLLSGVIRNLASPPSHGDYRDVAGCRSPGRPARPTCR
jgi:hypothetical protein